MHLPEAMTNRALSKFRAVIFDWDGVLAKTMEENFQAWSEAFHSTGIKINSQEYFLLEGMPALEVAKHFLRLYGLEENLAAEIKTKKEVAFQRNNTLNFYPSSIECIAYLHLRGLALALVTGASRSRLVGTGAIQYLADFKAIITADDVLKGKPDPEPYFKALNRLGVEAQSCLVVENAPLGIKAAKLAGMSVMALSTTLDPKFLQEADWVLPGMEAFLDSYQKT